MCVLDVGCDSNVQTTGVHVGRISRSIYPALFCCRCPVPFGEYWLPGSLSCSSPTKAVPNVAGARNSRSTRAKLTRLQNAPEAPRHQILLMKSVDRSPETPKHLTQQFHQSIITTAYTQHNPISAFPNCCDGVSSYQRRLRQQLDSL